MSLLASALGVCLAALVPEVAVATSTVPATSSTAAVPFTGTFRFAGGEAQRQGVVDAVERAVQALLPIFHELARKRLSAANVIPQAVTLSMEGDDLVVVYGDLEPQRAPLDGSVRTWHNREGTKVNLKHERRGNTLVQTSWGGGGRRVMVWSFDDEGKRLRLHSTMSSPHLPVAIDYRLTFAR
ncbi:hypothetical protein [Paraliomyxa miuraensis]|uniref:hypothetical protein n=1 Tax=Paraliomyxa miuraensis TaxID=376150 RepID=UPI0022501BB5|nr:hypothetical protein [Paraliomyxa miuraensis]MCX4247439.1 hypothetical protein [Paraliomyxa miuraensis]